MELSAAKVDSYLDGLYARCAPRVFKRHVASYLRNLYTRCDETATQRQVKFQTFLLAQLAQMSEGLEQALQTLEGTSATLDRMLQSVS